MRKLTKEELMESAASTEPIENEVGETGEAGIEETLEKESFINLNVTTVRATNEEMLNAIQSNIASCTECGTRIIKRKAKLACPNCHSEKLA